MQSNGYQEEGEKFLEETGRKFGCEISPHDGAGGGKKADPKGGARIDVAITPMTPGTYKCRRDNG